MQSFEFHTLHAVCTRYGPGRLPQAERGDIGAGYAAAAAAFIATVLYGSAVSIGAVLGMGFDAAVNLVFAALALPFVVPAAFLVGVGGWQLSPSYSSTAGIIAGGVGTIATYLVTLVLFGMVLTVFAALSLTGTDPVNAAMFSVGVVSTAFYFTCWITVPLGCLTGFVYVNVVTVTN